MRMIRNSLAIFLAMFMVMSPQTIAQEDTVETTIKPNILVMVADDLGWADVGYHGGDIDTPSLDLLAEQGVQLNRF